MGKFTDYIDKYDGENPSEYAQFKRDFEQTLTMLDVPVEKKYALFKACLTLGSIEEKNGVKTRAAPRETSEERKRTFLRNGTRRVP